MVDFATGNEGSDSVSLLYATSPGVLGAPTIASVGQVPNRPSVGDLDGDGDSDLAVANRDSDDVTIVMNSECTPTTPGDLDGDGDVDLSDLGALLASFGVDGGGDVDGDGDTDLADLGVALSNFGS
jgi:hypothetical protein